MKPVYNISYSRLALLLLPVALRRKACIALICALMRPLERLNGQFGGYRDAVDTSVCSQTCYLRGLLNDHFDYCRRRIVVRPAVINKDGYLLWQDQYHKPVMLCSEDSPDTYRPFLLNRDGQAGNENADFEIVLPKGYTMSETEENQLISLVNRHKLSSKKYSITYE